MGGGGGGGGVGPNCKQIDTQVLSVWNLDLSVEYLNLAKRMKNLIAKRRTHVHLMPTLLVLCSMVNTNRRTKPGVGLGTRCDALRESTANKLRSMDGPVFH